MTTLKIKNSSPNSKTTKSKSVKPSPSFSEGEGFHLRVIKTSPKYISSSSEDEDINKIKYKLKKITLPLLSSEDEDGKEKKSRRRVILPPKKIISSSNKGKEDEVKVHKKISSSSKIKDSKLPSKKKVGLHLLHQADIIIKKKCDYIKFWAYIASRLYIKQMILEDRYVVDDLKTYDVKVDLKEKEVVLDVVDALTEFYTLYNKDKTQTAEIDVLLTKYHDWYSVLLQRLYHKYIDTDFEVNEDKSAYPDIIILGE